MIQSDSPSFFSGIRKTLSGTDGRRLKTQRTRRNGSVLILVLACALVIIVVGAAIFFLTKVMGGGRELANATDAGAMNIAKNALRTPSKNVLTFTNPDIASNFAVLVGPTTTDVNLMNYNRLVAHSLLVAFNARDENTIESAHNAHKVWQALNEVGQYLHTGLTDSEKMAPYFQALTDNNNTRMLGNNQIKMPSYRTAFMHRGAATNIFIDPKVVEAANAKDDFPVASNSPSRPDGLKYMAGYQPVEVKLPATGETLSFLGVPLGPNDRPHLISTDAFNHEDTDTFATSKGTPAYPVKTLPPNAYLAGGATEENHGKMVVGAVAGAIVGCLGSSDPLSMRYGYIQIKNGDSAPGPLGSIAMQKDDIFCHALSGEGIYITGADPRDYFATGNKAMTTKSLDVDENMSHDQLKKELLDTNDEQLFNNDEVNRLLNEAQNGVGGLTTGAGGNWFSALKREAIQILKKDNYIDQWFIYNRIHNQLIKAILWRLNIPDRSESMKVIRHRDGRRLHTIKQLLDIDRNTIRLVFWHDYKQPLQSDAMELVMLDAFKRGYDQYGSADTGHIQQGGFTTLEQFKVNVMTQRTGCINCASIQAPATKSGVKFFDHSRKYPAPENSWNFGQVKTPFDYLTMIDTVPQSTPCAATTIIYKLTQRCQLIKPGTTREQVLELLKSQRLPLNSSLYMYLDNNSLRLSSSAPSWSIPATRPDGIGSSNATACGAAYDVIGTLVNTSSEPPNGPVKKLPSDPQIDPRTDGHYPGWAWRYSPAASCTDTAHFIPSSGYNQLLGVLDFSNGCSGGGQFCEPN